jgi:hypothetical protein
MELVIRDILLGVSKKDLYKRLLLWGEINRINLIVNRNWQTTYVYFKESKALNAFHIHT